MKTKLNEELIKKLEKRYEPNVIIETRFKGYDIAFKTDKEGNPILLFLVKRLKRALLKGNVMQEDY